MTSKTYWIAAEDLESARRRAYAVDAGRLPALPHYASEDAAQAWADHINGLLNVRVATVHAIRIEHRTVDDGRIPVARIVERVAEVTAALLLVVGGCWVVGWSTLI